VTELVPFAVLVIALGVIGVATGILIARRIDAWEVARSDATDGSDEEPDA
jgi:hypothetical protein